MKKIKITKQQSEMLKERFKRKRIKLTENQLRTIINKLGVNDVTLFESIELRNLLIEEEQIPQQSVRNKVSIKDFYTGILTVMKSKLSQETIDNIERLPQVFYDMRITREDIEQTIEELGLLGDSFLKLTYIDKVKTLKNKLKYAFYILKSKSDETSDKFAVGNKISEFAGIPDVIDDKTEVKKITIDSYKNIGTKDVLLHKADLDRYISGYTKRFREKPIFRYNGKHITVTNVPFTLLKMKHRTPKPKTEMTGTGSSGAFVGPMISDDIQAEMTGTGSSGAYDAPGFVKTKIGTKVGNMTQNFDIYGENLDNLKKTGWPDGQFVDFDSCTKLNNNKTAQNGGCNQGNSGVVKTKRSKDSVISQKP